MGDRTAPGAVPVITTPDFEAMVIGAHPDDDDFGAGAMSALWAKQGKKVVWVVMTDGTEGSEVPSMVDTELMTTREHEQRAAAETLGVKAVEFLRFPDGHLQNNEATRRELVRLIRQYRPRVVITHDPTLHIYAPDPNEKPDDTGFLNHSDHRATGNSVLDALYPFVGNPRSFRELLAQGLQPYKVHELYLFFSAGINTYIDVTETIDLKGKGLLCHATQFSPDSDIPNRIKERAAATAKEAKEKQGLDMEYAESFRRIKLFIPEEPKVEGEVPGVEEKVATK